MARKSGKHATLSVGGYAGADLHNVEIRMTADLIDVTALNDDWAVLLPGVGHWEVRAEKYYVTEAFLSLLKATPGAATPVTVTVGDGDQGTVFSGTGWVSESTFTLPNEAVTETIVIQGSGAPSTP
jgi:hypothetical protein